MVYIGKAQTIESSRVQGRISYFIDDAYNHTWNPWNSLRCGSVLDEL